MGGLRWRRGGWRRVCLRVMCRLYKGVCVCLERWGLGWWMGWWGVESLLWVEGVCVGDILCGRSELVLRQCRLGHSYFWKPKRCLSGW